MNSQHHRTLLDDDSYLPMGIVLCCSSSPYHSRTEIHHDPAAADDHDRDDYEQRMDLWEYKSLELDFGKTSVRTTCVRVLREVGRIHRSFHSDSAYFDQ